jgi:hypothetical protein
VGNPTTVVPETLIGQFQRDTLIRLSSNDGRQIRHARPRPIKIQFQSRTGHAELTTLSRVIHPQEGLELLHSK